MSSPDKLIDDVQHAFDALIQEIKADTLDDETIQTSLAVLECDNYCSGQAIRAALYVSSDSGKLLEFIHRTRENWPASIKPDKLIDDEGPFVNTPVDLNAFAAQSDDMFNAIKATIESDAAHQTANEWFEHAESMSGNQLVRYAYRRAFAALHAAYYRTHAHRGEILIFLDEGRSNDYTIAALKAGLNSTLDD